MKCKTYFVNFVLYLSDRILKSIHVYGFLIVQDIFFYAKCCYVRKEMCRT